MVVGRERTRQSSGDCLFPASGSCHQARVLSILTYRYMVMARRSRVEYNCI